MSWLLPRLLVLLAALVLGLLAGQWLGAMAGAPDMGAVAGAAVAVALVALGDSLRAHRLMQWLRGNQEDSAPRDTGFWGEMGYRAERALRDREQAQAAEHERLVQFLAAVEASPNGVLLLDETGHIEWCSRVAAAHLGLDPQRDRGQPITNLVRAPAFVAHLQSGEHGEPVSFAGPGRDTMLSVLVRPYGEGQRLVLTQDVTERLRADGMRRDFVANVSHEIRTPLTVLAGFVETMASLPLTAVERERVLHLMEQQTNRMQALVADLLTLAQLEGSPRPPTDRWVPVESLLQRVRADGATLSAGRHRLQVAEGVGAQLAGNEGELLSALGNLVNNAIRYTPAGGQVQGSWIDRPDGSGVLEVTDTGPGIAREHLPRLTERFYRVDGSRSRETGGTGLGLSIVKHAVQRHGGELEIESEPGRGSRFRLVLPAARVRRQRSEEAAATLVG